MKKVIFAVLFLFSFSFCFSQEKNIPISFSVKEEGKVSAGIYDKEGRIIKTLLTGKKYQSGDYTINWDGKDQGGKEVEKGEYTYKIVLNPGVKAEYIMSVGNAGDPPYKTPDGKGSWGGVWGNVRDVATDQTGVYLLWGQEEGQGALVKVDKDGKVIWKQHNNWDWGNCISVASNGEKVFVLNSQSCKEEKLKGYLQAFIWQVDANTGEYKFFSPEKYATIGNPIKPQRIITFWEEIYESNFSLLPEVPSMGIAVDKKNIYVTLYYENRVAILDINTGKEIDSISRIEKPIGIDVRDNFLYVVSEDKILRIDLTTEEKKELVKKLDHPYGICIDEDRKIYVTTRGKTQQIFVFTNNGLKIKEIGKKGGRNYQGKHIPDGLLMPNGLAVEFGKIYIGDSGKFLPPRRVAIFSTDGKFLTEWIGPHYYSTSCLIDPYNLEDIYSGVDGKNILRFKINWKDKTWRMDAYWPFFFWHGNPNRKFSLNPIGQPRPLIVEKNNKKYLFLGGGFLPLYLIDGYNLVLQTVVSITFIWTDDEKGWIPKESPSQWGKYESQTISKKFPDKTVAVWKDYNNDLQCQVKDELITYNFSPTGRTYWAGWITKNMDIYWLSTNGNILYLPFQGFDDKGIPIYTWEKAKNIPHPVFSYHSGMGVDDEGNIYVSGIIDGASKGIGWASNTKDAWLAKYSPEGKVIYKVGRKATGFAKPGEFYRCINIGGFIDDFVFVVDVNGQDKIWTKDGLYVDSLLEDIYRGPLPSPYTLWVEHFNSNIFKGKDGKAYFVAGSDAIHIWEIKGLENVKKIEGKIQF